MTAIRTLGLYQPYAGLMAYGKIETRWVKKGKKPPFPLAEYLLYSTKKRYEDFEFRSIAGEMWYKKSTEIRMSDKTGIFHRDGYAILLGRLSHIIDTDGIVMNDLDKGLLKTFVDVGYETETHRLVGLVFEGIQRIKPFQFNGKQGVGILSPEDFQKIEIL